MKKATNRQADAPTLELADQRIETFFAAYEQRFMEGLTGKTDVEATANAFAPYFVAANPFAVNGGKNDEGFRKTIPQGMDFYKKIGTTAMKVAAVDTTVIDDLHWMARVHWQSFYTKKTGQEERIDFEVVYLLQEIGGELKIFAYITGDEQGLLREHGLIE